MRRVRKVETLRGLSHWRSISFRYVHGDHASDSGVVSPCSSGRGLRISSSVLPPNPPIPLAHMGAFSRSRRGVHGSCREEGIALLGMLLTIIVLGVMVLIVLNTLGGSPSRTGTTTTIPGATTTTAPATAERGAREAASAACQANYLAIETALADYRSLNGSLPPAGTAWATATTKGGPYLQVWPESARYYSFTWNGAQLSVIPVTGASSQGSDGSSSSKSGCFAA